MGQAGSSNGCIGHFLPIPKMAAMKAAKAMKAMKAMKAKKVISAKLQRRHLFSGKADKSKCGLKKGDFLKNKAGKIVSKKRSAIAKTSTWMVAIKAARAALGIKGFCACKKGSALYKKAKELQKK